MSGLNEFNFLQDIKNLVTGTDRGVGAGSLPDDGGFRVDRNYPLADIIGAAGAAGGASNSSEFYGLTAGTGNSTTTDYAATVAVHTAAGTGRVPFPRLGPQVPGQATYSSTTLGVTIANAGSYLISFNVQTTEAGQLELELNGAPLVYTLTGNQNPTSGGHRYVGSYVVTVPANGVIAVINAAGNSSALTITPANGSQTNAEAQTLSVMSLAGSAVVSPITTSFLNSTILVYSVASGGSTIGSLLYAIPRDYDEASDEFHLRIMASMSGSTNVDSPVLAATLFRQRGNLAVPAGFTASTVVADFNRFSATVPATLSSTVAVYEIDLSSQGLLRDDALTIALTSGPHTTNAIQLYFIEFTYRSCLVSYNETTKLLPVGSNPLDNKTLSELR